MSCAKKEKEKKACTYHIFIQRTKIINSGAGVVSTPSCSRIYINIISPACPVVAGLTVLAVDRSPPLTENGTVRVLKLREHDTIRG